MQLSMSHNFPAVKARMAQLDEDIRNRAGVSAVNKMADQAKTAMSREITDRYALQSAYVKDRLKIRRASFRNGDLNIEATLVGGDGKRRSANLIAFVEKSTTMAQARKRAKRGTLRQVYVKVKKGGPAKPVQGAFVGNKGRTLFERVGKARLPIRPVQVIDVPQMFNTKAINANVMRLIRSKFPVIFENEVRFYLDRFMAGR